MKFPSYAANFELKPMGFERFAEIYTVLFDGVGGLVATTK